MFILISNSECAYDLEWEGFRKGKVLGERVSRKGRWVIWSWFFVSISFLLWAIYFKAYILRNDAISIYVYLLLAPWNLKMGGEIGFDYMYPSIYSPTKNLSNCHDNVFWGTRIIIGIIHLSINGVVSKMRKITIFSNELDNCSYHETALAVR